MRHGAGEDAEMTRYQMEAQEIGGECWWVVLTHPKARVEIRSEAFSSKGTALQHLLSVNNYLQYAPRLEHSTDGKTFSIEAVN